MRKAVATSLLAAVLIQLATLARAETKPPAKPSDCGADQQWDPSTKSCKPKP